MNIGNVKGMLGDAVSNEVRTLELKIGQVVRGVVLQQYDNSEALVNINGVQVRAKLEIPLMEGQAALLQVQPDSKGSYILLKQVDPTTLGLNDPMKDILKSMSMPDKGWANEIVKDLRREGFPLNKETAAAFQKAAQLIPPGVSQEEWMQAAATAFKRGLPITQATVSALHQLQHGNPLHSIIDQLKGQLLQLQQANNSNQPISTQTAALLNQLNALLDEGTTVIRSMVTNGALPQAQMAGSTSTNGAMAPQAQAGIQEQGVNPLTTQQGAEAATGNSNQNNNLSLLLKWLGVSHESTFGKQIFSQQAPNSNQAATQTNVNAAVAGNGNNQNQSQQNVTQAAPNSTQATSTGVQQANAPQTTASQQSSPIANTATQLTNAGTLQQALQVSSNQQSTGEQTTTTAQQQASGANTTSNPSQNTFVQGQAHNVVNHPQQVMPGVLQAQISSQDGNQMLNQAPIQSIGLGTAQGDSSLTQPHAIASQAAQTTQAASDSLKSAIMQVMQSNDVPAAVKETAQQLLSAITGQQLMLSTERNHSVFSHVTMYIPLQDKEGSQTATVHIQTRRDRKGELDSDNCRIVFDLNMNAIGPTLVDVNIINKIVSLNLWNDHPLIAPVIDAMKPEINEALMKTGYVLSSLRTTPIPTIEEEGNQTTDAKKIKLPPDVEVMNSTRYKGVDFKV